MRGLSKPRILADENIEATLVKFLEIRFDVETAPKGAENSELYSLATKKERILVTHDHDFLNTELYKPISGTVVLPVYPLDKAKETLSRFLGKYEMQDIKGKAFLLTEEWFVSGEQQTKSSFQDSENTL